MPELSIRVDDQNAVVALDRFDADIEARLRDVVGSLEEEFLAQVLARAPERSGAYRRSIRGAVSPSETGAWARVSANVFYASFLERGAVIPPHEILPDVAQALRMSFAGGERFAGRVESPGGTIAPEEIFKTVLDNMQTEIIDRITDAVNGAAQDV